VKKMLFSLAIVCAATFSHAGVLEDQCNDLRNRIGTKVDEAVIQDQLSIFLEKLKDNPETEAAVLGTLYLCGVGVPQNVGLAIEHWKAVALQARGDLQEAAFGILISYFAGTFGQPPDKDKLVDWLLRGGKAGVPSMQLALATEYFNGGLFPKDLGESERWYLKLAAAGNPEAYLRLGQIHIEKKNYPEAMKWLRLGTSANQAESYALLSYIYFEGLGIPVDKTEALRLMKIAAKTLPRAQYFIGQMYWEGRGVAIDPVEAVKWFRLSADAGFADGQEALAWAYETGFGVAVDTELSNFWRKKAVAGNSGLAKFRIESAERTARAQEAMRKEVQEREDILRRALDDGTAKSKIALAYFLGRRNSKEVVSLLEAAVNQGSAEAAYKLGIVYIYRQSGTDDPAQGHLLIKKAAAQGHTDALVWLARAFYQGTDFKKDLGLSYALHALASFSSADMAKGLDAFRPPFDDAMSDKEVIRARELVISLENRDSFLEVLDKAARSDSVF
jgi:TPR repeat protein